MALNDRQQRFVLEYLFDLNATQAAIRAGYSERSAAAQAVALMKKPEVQAAILDAKRRQTERVDLTVEWVLRKLSQEANYFGRGTSHAARVKATELIGKHAGAFEDVVRVIPGSEEEKSPYERRLAEFRTRYGDPGASAPAPTGGEGGGNGGGPDALPADGTDARP